MRVVVVALACVLAMGCVRSHMPPRSSLGLQAEMAFHFKAVAFDSLDALPARVRETSLDALRERTGDFFPRLMFSGAQYRTYEDDTAPEYVVEFQFTDAAAGIEAFHAQIRLSADGSILAPFGLPDFRRSPDKMHFAAMPDVEARARREGCDPGSALLVYDARSDAIAWNFDERTRGSARSGSW